MRSAQQPINTSRSYTAREFARLPEGPPYYELIMNQLVMPPPPDYYHQVASSNLHFAFNLFVRPQSLGIVLAAPLDVFFDETNVFQPDLVFIRRERLPGLLGEDRKIHGAPDLVVGFLSSNRKSDLIKKRRVYERHGVREYWLVDSKKQTVEVFSLENGAFITREKAEKSGPIRSDLLPGFEIDLESLFATGLSL